MNLSWNNCSTLIKFHLYIVLISLNDLLTLFEQQRNQSKQVDSVFSSLIMFAVKKSWCLLLVINFWEILVFVRVRFVFVFQLFSIFWVSLSKFSVARNGQDQLNPIPIHSFFALNFWLKSNHFYQFLIMTSALKVCYVQMGLILCSKFPLLKVFRVSSILIMLSNP